MILKNPSLDKIMVMMMLNVKKFVMKKVDNGFGLSKETWDFLRFKTFHKTSVKISGCLAYILFYDEKESDHEGTRTLNLPIRSRMPYPLGHAASHMKAKILLLCIRG